jgi:hypothetical protein
MVPNSIVCIWYWRGWAPDCVCMPIAACDLAWYRDVGPSPSSSNSAGAGKGHGDGQCCPRPTYEYAGDDGGRCVSVS